MAPKAAAVPTKATSRTTTTDKGKAPVTRQQSAANEAEAAGQALHLEHQKTSEDEGTKEDENSTRVASTSNQEALDDQLIEAVRADLEALSKILIELR